MPKPAIGKTYLYKGNETKILDLQQKGRDLYEVTTDKRTFRINVGDFKEFLLVEAPFESKNNTALIVVAQEYNRPLKTLTEKLMQMMEKVETDATFIPRAKMMNETAKNIIAIAKTQVDMMRTIRK